MFIWTSLTFKDRPNFTQALIEDGLDEDVKLIHMLELLIVIIPMNEDKMS